MRDRSCLLEQVSQKGRKEPRRQGNEGSLGTVIRCILLFIVFSVKITSNTVHGAEKVSIFLNDTFTGQEWNRGVSSSTASVEHHNDLICQDNTFYRSPQGLPCDSYSQWKCQEFLHVGFTKDEIQEMISNCPESCNSPLCRSKLLSPLPRNIKTSMNSLKAEMTRSVPTTQEGRILDNTHIESACNEFDDPNYISPQGLPCWKYGEWDCTKFASIGFSEIQVYTLVNSCRKSCLDIGPCQDFTMTPTVPPTETPSFSAAPTAYPSVLPTIGLSGSPSSIESELPSYTRSTRPSQNPTSVPSLAPYAPHSTMESSTRNRDSSIVPSLSHYWNSNPRSSLSSAEKTLGDSAELFHASASSTEAQSKTPSASTSFAPSEVPSEMHPRSQILRVSSKIEILVMPVSSVRMNTETLQEFTDVVEVFLIALLSETDPPFRNVNAKPLMQTVETTGGDRRALAVQKSYGRELQSFRNKIVLNVKGEYEHQRGSSQKPSFALLVAQVVNLNSSALVRSLKGSANRYFHDVNNIEAQPLPILLGGELKTDKRSREHTKGAKSDSSSSSSLRIIAILVIAVSIALGLVLTLYVIRMRRRNAYSESDVDEQESEWTEDYDEGTSRPWTEDEEQDDKQKHYLSTWTEKVQTIRRNSTKVPEIETTPSPMLYPVPGNMMSYVPSSDFMTSTVGQTGSSQITSDMDQSSAQLSSMDQPFSSHVT